ncbi:MAG: hypothetical protein WBQ08_16705 [Candidatus Sulfotelmatobacter sp.]
MKRVTILVLILAISTLAVARDKKAKVTPGPYVFTSKASAQTIKALLVQESLRDGYALDSEHELQFRFSRPAQMPLYGQIFMASSTSVCPGMPTKQVWSYTLAESNGVTKVTVQPAWDYPDDYCKVQTNAVPWSKPEEMVAFQAMLDKAPAAVAAAPATKPAAVAATVAGAGAPSATAVAYRQKDNVSAGVATQPAAQAATQSASRSATQAATQTPGVAQDDATRRAQQHQACLGLAKDNPSITCK